MMSIRLEEELLEEEVMEKILEEVEEKGDEEMIDQQDDFGNGGGTQEIKTEGICRMENEVVTPHSPLMASPPRGVRKFHSPTRAVT